MSAHFWGEGGWGCHVFPEDGGGAGAAVGEEGVVGDDAADGPAAATIEPFGVAAGDRVEDERGAAGSGGLVFDAAEERLADAAAAGTAVDEHLRDVGAMGLVLGDRGAQVDGAADAFAVTGDEEDGFVPSDLCRHAFPEMDGALMGKGPHEVHGGAALYTIHEHGGERVDGVRGGGVVEAFDGVAAHAGSWTTRYSAGSPAWISKRVGRSMTAKRQSPAMRTFASPPMVKVSAPASM